MLIRLKENWLLILFTLSLAWTCFWLGILPFAQLIISLNPFPEGYQLHVAFAETFPFLVVIAATGVGAKNVQSDSSQSD